MHEDALVQKIWEYIITDEFLFLIINHSNSCPCHCMNNEIMFVFDFVENHLGFEYVAAKANSSCGKLEMKVLSECQRCPRQELVSHRFKQLKATKPVFSVVRVYGEEFAWGSCWQDMLL